MYSISYFTQCTVSDTKQNEQYDTIQNESDTAQMYCILYCTLCTVIKLVYGLCDDEIEGLKSGR